MTENEVVIPLTELNRMEIICPKCNSSVTLGSKVDGYFPTNCAACNEVLAVGISNIAAAWKDFLTKAKPATIRFRVKQNS